MDRCLFACGFVLALSLGRMVEVRSQELDGFPSDVGLSRSEGETLEFRQRIEELETALARIEASNRIDLPISEPEPGQPAVDCLPPTRGSRHLESILGADFGFKFGGYVKADFIHDFDAILSTDSFDPLTIPTDGRPGENTRLHARQTRFNLDYRPDRRCEQIRLFAEGDFFGVGSSFRLRHAFVRVGHLIAGQTWSTFMDESILPATLDFESARSVILDRRGLVRWTQPVTESLALAIALEDPQPLLDQTFAPNGDVKRTAPDVISRARYEAQFGHLQAAGLVRTIRYRAASGGRDDAVGWGVNCTGRANLRECDSVLFQVALGEGLESYRQAPDGAVDANGIIELNPLIAYVVGYEVDWTDRLSSTFVYSAAEGENAAFQPATAPKATQYVASNLVFRPRPQLSYGIEYLYGTRTNKNDAKGSAHRLQMSIRYDLP